MTVILCVQGETSTPSTHRVDALTFPGFSQLTTLNFGGAFYTVLLASLWFYPPREYGISLCWDARYFEAFLGAIRTRSWCAASRDGGKHAKNNCHVGRGAIALTLPHYVVTSKRIRRIADQRHESQSGCSNSNKALVRSYSTLFMHVSAWSLYRN